MSKKSWNIIEIVGNCIFIIIGLIGITYNLVHIDDMIMNHFDSFCGMTAAYIVFFIGGWHGLSHEE